MNHITYISAGAGSGKTFTLTSILADLIVNGKAEPEQFILTTFTEKAAAEFKEKAKAMLYGHLASDKKDVTGIAEKAERLDQAMIGTIDSVAYSYVQKYWYLLGISPNLNIIDDNQKKFFIGQVLQSIAKPDENAFLKDFCEQFNIYYSFGKEKTSGLNYDFWKEDITVFFEKNKSYNIRDLEESKKKSILFAKEITSENALEYDADELKSLLLDIEKVDKPQKGKTKTPRTDDINELKFLLSREMKLSTLSKYRKFLDNCAKGKELFKKIQQIPLHNKVDSNLKCIYTSIESRKLIIQYIELIFKYVKDSQCAFEEYKKRQHLIDYTDMEIFFKELLKKNEVQEDIRKNYKYVFVDEFQDSSPIQVEIFDRLSEIVGDDLCDDEIIRIGEGKKSRDFHIHNSIWVGDIKQAIYGFRGADTELTKAVTDIIAAKQSKDPKRFAIDSLDTCFRSKRDIVEFTNKIFVKAFGKSDDNKDDNEWIDEKFVTLKPNRENTDGLQVLKYWKIEGSKKDDLLKNLALQIAKRIEEKEKPSDYAVLARGNSDLNTISNELKKLGIPICRSSQIDDKKDELVLLTALLHLIQDSNDDYYRAVAVFLTQKDFDVGKIIDSRLENKKPDKSGETYKSTYLADKPIITKLLQKLEFYKSQTIHNLVESLVVDCDLYTVGKSWEGATGTDEAFMALIEAAYDYEERCGQMGLAPTIDGYLEYCKENAMSSGSKDGVVLDTFHGSKGLEWKKVILLSLDEDAEDEKNLFKYDVFGIQNYHEQAPSEKNLYPPMLINLMPNIFSGNTNVAEEMAEKIRNTDFFAKTKKRAVSEVKRLMYVAITRARDELILTVTPKDYLSVFKNLNCNLKNEPNYDAENGIDFWDCGHSFAFESKKIDEQDLIKTDIPQKIELKPNEKFEETPRDQQPSKVKPTKKASAKIIYDSEFCINAKANPNEMDKFGTCIHNIFCVLEKSPTMETVERIIKNHQMEAALPEPGDVLKAWQNLEKFLSDTYGAKVATYHELPFKYMHDGQIFNGEMDLVWETDKGVVLVDFKSYRGNKNDVVTEDHDHYAGMYAGQFECYDRALTAAGKKVLARLVYYHVLGVVVELK